MHREVRCIFQQGSSALSLSPHWSTKITSEQGHRLKWLPHLFIPSEPCPSSPRAFPQPLQHRLIFPFTKLWTKGLSMTLPSVIKSCISLLWLRLHPRYQSPLPSVVVTFFQGQGSLTLLGLTAVLMTEINQRIWVSTYRAERRGPWKGPGRPASTLMGSGSYRAGIGVSSPWHWTKGLQGKEGKDVRSSVIWEKNEENLNSPGTWLSGINWLFPFLLGISLEEEEGPEKGELGR